MNSKRILIVEDDVSARLSMTDYLEMQGFVVDEAENARAAESVFRLRRPDAVLMDYRLPDGTALDLLPRLQSIDPQIPVVLLTGNGTIDVAVRAIKQGAQNFLTKPVELSVLATILERLIEDQRNFRKVAARKREQRFADPFVARSSRAAQLRELAERVASSDSAVLITGETGSGKGMLARWIHEHSPRANDAFVNLNCAGLSRELFESELFGFEKGAFTGATSSKQGLLEIAHHGTVFLDEIGDADSQAQPKLLKVLEEKTFRRLGEVRDRHVDIRLIAATNQDLAGLIREKRFRSDLYFRINTFPLAVPPLRERAEDIPLIARQFLSEHRKELTPAAEAALMRYHWPGNVRELRNVLERAALLSRGETIDARELFFDPLEHATDLDSSAGLTLAEVERRHILRALEAEQGNVERAAKRLGVPRSTLYQRIKRG